MEEEYWCVGIILVIIVLAVIFLCCRDNFNGRRKCKGKKKVKKCKKSKKVCSPKKKKCKKPKKPCANSNVQSNPCSNPCSAPANPCSNPCPNPCVDPCGRLCIRNQLITASTYQFLDASQVPIGTPISVPAGSNVRAVVPAGAQYITFANVTTIGTFALGFPSYTLVTVGTVPTVQTSTTDLCVGVF